MNNTVTGNCWCLIVTLPEGEHEYKVYTMRYLITAPLSTRGGGENVIHIRNARAGNNHRHTVHTAYSARGGTTKNWHYSRFGTKSDITTGRGIRLATGLG